MADIPNPASRLLNYQLSNEVGASLNIETIDKKNYIVLLSKSGKILTRLELASTVSPTVLSTNDQLKTIFTNRTFLIQYEGKYYILSSFSETQAIYTSTVIDDFGSLSVAYLKITKSDTTYSISSGTASGGSGTAAKYVEDVDEPYIEL